MVVQNKHLEELKASTMKKIEKAFEAVKQAYAPVQQEMEKEKKEVEKARLNLQKEIAAFQADEDEYMMQIKDGQTAHVQKQAEQRKQKEELANRRRICEEKLLKLEKEVLPQVEALEVQVIAKKQQLKKKRNELKDGQDEYVKYEAKLKETKEALRVLQLKQEEQDVAISEAQAELMKELKLLAEVQKELVETELATEQLKGE